MVYLPKLGCFFNGKCGNIPYMDPMELECWCFVEPLDLRKV